MYPRKGDIFECQQCQLRFVVTNGCHFSELQTENLRCCCGATPILLQSGSESAEELEINRILQAELRHGGDEFVPAGIAAP